MLILEMPSDEKGSPGRGRTRPGKTEGMEVNSLNRHPPRQDPISNVNGLEVWSSAGKMVAREASPYTAWLFRVGVSTVENVLDLLSLPTDSSTNTSRILEGRDLRNRA